MANRNKFPVTKSAAQLAKLLNLSPEDGIEMEFRAQLLIKITDVVKRRGLTHDQVAKLARASRTRVTAILNGRTSGISTDLMLRILYSLGYRVKVRFLTRRAA